MIGVEHNTAVGVFENRTRAEKAIEELHRAGFRDEQIGLAVRSGDVTAPLPETSEAETAVGGTAAGALTGGAFGAVLGALVTGLVPGVGFVLASGLLAGIVGGAAVGAATGGVVGLLMSLGLTEEEADSYEKELRAGRTLVTVKAGNRYAEALEILQRNGAYDVKAPISTPGGIMW